MLIRAGLVDMVDVLEVSLRNFLIFRVGIGSELALLRLVEDFEGLDGIFILSWTLSTQRWTEQPLTSSFLVTPLVGGVSVARLLAWD